MSKPIIRHCRNCKYYQYEGVVFDCPVLWKYTILFPRLKLYYVDSLQRRRTTNVRTSNIYMYPNRII